MRFARLLSTVVLVMAATTAQAVREGAQPAREGHQLEWLPYASGNYTVNAAINDFGLIVVLYNPQAISELPDEIARFVMLREEQVGLLASELLQSGKLSVEQIRRSSEPDLSRRSGRFTPISEPLVYESPAVRRFEDRGLDSVGRINCLTFRELSDRERSAFLNAYENYGERLPLIFGDGRIKRPREMAADLRRCR